MKSARTVIFALVGFTVIAGSVLAWGLLRKSATRRQTQALLSAADDILSVSLPDLAGRSDDERKELLERARKLRREIESDGDAPPEQAELLGTWIARGSAFEASVRRKERELAALERALDVGLAAGGGPPSQGGAVEQLAPSTADALRAAAARAGKLRQLLHTTVDGQTVDLSPLFRATADRIRGQAAKVVAELARRENAFQRFVGSIRTALEGGRLAEARIRAQSLDDWLCCVVDAPEKKRVLEELARKVPGESEQTRAREGVEARLDGLTRGLKSTTDEEVQVALIQYDEVSRSAQRLGGFDSELAELAEARERALERRHREQASAKKRRNDRKLTENILWEILALAQLKAKAASLEGPGQRTGVQAKLTAQAARVEQLLAKLNAAAPLGAFLANLLSEQVRESPQPGEAKKPTIVKRYTQPAWRRLDSSLRRLDASGKACRESKMLELREVGLALGKYRLALEKFKSDHAKRVAELNKEEQDRLKKEQQRLKRKQQLR